MPSKGGPNIITDGLVFAVDAADKLSYPGSGTTWKDLSGNGNDGTLTNGPTFDSGNGGSIVFDGANDYVTFGDNPLFNFGTNNFTLQYAYKSSYTGAQGKQVIGKTNGGGASSTYGWLVVSFTTEIGFAAASVGGSWGSAGTYIKKTTGANVNDGNWYIITISVDKSLSDVKIYKNQILQNLTIWAGSGGDLSTVGNISNSLDMRLGIESDNAYPYSGNISNTYIYNRALTSQEITQNYNALKSRFNL